MPLHTLRAKPVEVAAIQYTGDNTHEINRALLGPRYGQKPGLRPFPGSQAYPRTYQRDDVTAELWNAADAQWQPVGAGDWIIRGLDGSLYAAPAAVVAEKYDVIT
ncbi:hypothetical protein [Nocardia puris]|uniref:hypothetical protein n=1 Tax=Nocardia puris TaxID=208602 RepID=UPI002E1C3EBD